MKLLLFLFLFFCFPAWAKVNLELVLDSSSVKQGEIAGGSLIVKESQGQTAFSGLKGKNLGKTLYLFNLEPFIGKQGVLQSKVKVIFLAVPQQNWVTENVEGEEIFISWKDIQVIPTEETKSFLLANFEVPDRKKILPWFIGLLVLFILGGLGFWINRKIKSKKLSKAQLEKLKAEILGCRSYDDIVLMWRQKRTYLNSFPQLESAFKSFEETLFKYQFKPQRTESEIEEVKKAYDKFKSDSGGGLNGI